MGWVYIDDHFPEHPKVQAAGDKAAWLYVAALCYVNRNHTLGQIPRSVVTRLTGFNDAPMLAEKLVKARLWEPGDSYEVHDYVPWNESQIRRSEKARKAAQTRWGARSNAQASTEHVPPGKPRASTEQNGSNAHAMPSPKALVPRPSSNGCTGPLSSSKLSEHDDDDDDGQESRHPGAWQAAQAALNRLRADKPDRRIMFPEKWLQVAYQRELRTITENSARRADEIQHDLETIDDLPEDVASSWRETHSKLKKLVCERCDNHRYIDIDDNTNTVIPCPDCRPRGVTA